MALKNNEVVGINPEEESEKCSGYDSSVIVPSMTLNSSGANKGMIL